MDEARRFRFLIPPFFLAVSFTAGLYFSEFKFDEFLKSYSTEQLLAFGAVIGASILPVGFLLTSLSILGLHLCALVSGCGTYEAVLPNESWKRMWPWLSTRLPVETRWHLYAAATLDHALLAPGIHEWIQRRWTTFNLSVHSFTAVAIAHLAAPLPAIRETWPWEGFDGYVTGRLRHHRVHCMGSDHEDARVSGLSGRQHFSTAG